MEQRGSPGSGSGAQPSGRHRGLRRTDGGVAHSRGGALQRLFGPARGRGGRTGDAGENIGTRSLAQSEREREGEREKERERKREREEGEREEEREKERERRRERETGT